MKHLFKRSWLALILVLVALLCMMTACNGGDETTGTTAAPNPTGTTGTTATTGTTSRVEDGKTLISVEYGKLSDGTVEGRFEPGTQITLTADAPEESFMTFDCWKNSMGQTVGVHPTMTVTVPSYSETYMACYRDMRVAITAIEGKVNGLNSTKVMPGTEVTLVANTPAQGYIFSHWENSKGAKSELVSAISFDCKVLLESEDVEARLEKEYKNGKKPWDPDGAETPGAEVHS